MFEGICDPKQRETSVPKSKMLNTASGRHQDYQFIVNEVIPGPSTRYGLATLVPEPANLLHSLDESQAKLPLPL